ncbi:MAG: ABC transporter ATP-binding protein [Steroidobacteraceae bacterium]
MTQIRIAGLTKRYGATVALSSIDLEIGTGELFFLLGPSGCGKTTLLRLIAGLQMPSSGRILFDSRDVTSVPTQQRNAVMCFQGYALWPHMTVRENIRFGLSVRQTPPDRESQQAEVERALEIIQMQGPLADRKPQQLSGGQQQRVALARALAVRPSCLLLDEPLSNLDTQLRQEMRREIQRICRQAGITTVYVTHDQKEALSTADRIAVMRDGQLAQVGTPEELYRSPSSAFVAGFIGPTNLIEGEVTGSSDGFTQVATAIGQIRAVCGAGEGATAPATRRVLVSIRPELIRIVRDGVGRDEGGGDGAPAGGLAGPIRSSAGDGTGGNPADNNRVVGAIVEDTFLGQSSEHLVAVGNGHLRVVSAPPQYGLGGKVILDFKPGDVVVLDR